MWHVGECGTSTGRALRLCSFRSTETMTRKYRWRWAAVVASLGLILLWAALPVAGQAPSFTTEHGEWQTYGGDLKSTRYSPLDQITADNFNKLEVACRF